MTLLLRASRYLALGVLSLLLLCGTSAAEDCQQEKIDQFVSGAPESFGADYQRGILYLEAGCLTNAVQFLQLSKQKMPKDWAPSFQSIIDDGLEIADIVKDLRNGALSRAQERFATLFDRSPITRRLAVNVLGEKLQLETNDKAWNRVQAMVLRCAAEVDGDFWCKDVAIRHLIKTAGLAEAVKRLENMLRDPLSRSGEMHLQVLHADLLIKSRRLAEATLLLAQLDDDVQKRLLDGKATRLYYALCVQVWEQRARSSSSEADLERLGRYRSYLTFMDSQDKQ